MTNVQKYDIVLLEGHKNYGFGIVTKSNDDGSVLVQWPNRMKKDKREVQSKNPCVYFNIDKLIHVYRKSEQFKLCKI